MTSLRVMIPTTRLVASVTARCRNPSEVNMTCTLVAEKPACTASGAACMNDPTSSVFSPVSAPAPSTSANAGEPAVRGDADSPRCLSSATRDHPPAAFTISSASSSSAYAASAPTVPDPPSPLEPNSDPNARALARQPRGRRSTAGRVRARALVVVVVAGDAREERRDATSSVRLRAEMSLFALHVSRERFDG